ncbi:hypothetical protein GGR02_002243 [Anoxybacillus voinovskiensis]|uniref:Uncharacterized protein n=1 Tax=Anoxybacteroides voinovskiense TaxID=230470 RepID=A0A840DZR1_9BACL|nr:hypothetical protein [Anoxybacillus voinovskiensis]MBB4074476.1 hypothetical protein [Anoxybacillus voinovskiensis]GGJ79173.1 hypothetical protein GCM10008982_30670 [Anoxybacillus voinovskiensis]
MFARVDKVKAKVDAHRPLPARLVKNLREVSRIAARLSKATLGNVRKGRGNIEPFVTLVATCVEESLRQYLQALGIDKQGDSDG